MSLSDIVTGQLKKELNERSESKAQRRLMGWVHACQKGEASSCPSRIEKIGKSMSSGETRKFAKTKEKGLPEKKHPEKDIRKEAVDTSRPMSGARAVQDFAVMTHMPDILLAGEEEGVTLADLDSEGVLGEADELATTPNKDARPDSEWVPRFEDQPDDAGEPQWQEPKADWNSIKHRDSMHGLIKQTLNPDMEDRAYKKPDPSRKMGKPQIKTVKYNEAIRVEHPLKGKGTVVSLGEGRAVIEWDRLDLRPLGPEVLTKEQAQWVSVIREEYSTDPEEAEMGPKRKKKRKDDDRMEEGDVVSMGGERESPDLFSPQQITVLRNRYGSIGKIDPYGPTYSKLIDLLDHASDARLKQIAGADIKFVSKLARNRLMRRGIAEERDESSKNAITMVVNKDGWILTKDGKWRDAPIFGTPRWAAKLYKRVSTAVPVARKLRAKVVSVPSDESVERYVEWGGRVIERRPIPGNPDYVKVSNAKLSDFVVADFTKERVQEDQYETQPSVQIAPPPSTTIFQDQETDDDWDPEPLATQRGAEAAPKGDSPEGEMEEPDDAPGDLEVDHQDIPNSKKAKQIAGKVFRAFSGEGGDHSEIDYKSSQAGYERQDDDSQNRTDREPEEADEEEDNEEEDNKEERKEKTESLSLVDFDVEGILG